MADSNRALAISVPLREESFRFSPKFHDFLTNNAPNSAAMNIQFIVNVQFIIEMMAPPFSVNYHQINAYY